MLNFFCRLSPTLRPRSRPLCAVSAQSPPSSRNELIFSTRMSCFESPERRRACRGRAKWFRVAKPFSRCCCCCCSSTSLPRFSPPPPPLSPSFSLSRAPSVLLHILLPPPHIPQVQLSSGPHKASATTCGQGYFELDVPDAPSLSALSGSLLRLDRESDGNCLDTAVGLAPPISLGALVPVFEKGENVFFMEDSAKKNKRGQQQEKRGKREVGRKPPPPPPFFFFPLSPHPQKT